MFNDKYGLTQAVLEGLKTQTRRIITPQPTYQDNCGICWKGYAYGLSLSNELLGCYINFVSGTEYDKSCKRYRKGECVAAIIKLYRCEDFDNELVLKKIKLNPRAFTPCVNSDDYIRMIEDIVNFRSRNKVRFNVYSK